MFTRTLAASSNEDAEHIPLMGDADDPRGDVQQRQRSDVSKLGYPRLLPLLVLSALATSLLSFMWNGNQLNNRFHRPSIDVPSLRHPSLYIGLDRVPEIKSVLASQQATANSDNHHETMPTLSVPIHGRPRRIVRVNSDYPGTVYPEDHWVLLSKKDVTFMVFQPPQGSTSCKISSFLPRRHDLGDKMLTLEGTSPRIQVGLLSAHQQLNNTTWGSRPSTDLILGSFGAGFGENDATPTFSCAGDSPTIIELSCIGDGCRVEYEDATEFLPLLGIYLLGGIDL